MSVCLYEDRTPDVHCSAAVGDAILAHAGLLPGSGHVTAAVDGVPFELRLQQSTACCYRIHAAGNLLRAVGACHGDTLLRLVPLPGGTFAASAEPEPSQDLGPAGLVARVSVTALTKGDHRFTAPILKAMLRHAGHSSDAVSGLLRCRVDGLEEEFVLRGRLAYASGRLHGRITRLKPLLHALNGKQGDVLHLEPQPGGSFLARTAGAADGAQMLLQAAASLEGLGAAALGSETRHTSHGGSGAAKVIARCTARGTGAHASEDGSCSESAGAASADGGSGLCRRGSVSGDTTGSATSAEEAMARPPPARIQSPRSQPLWQTPLPDPAPDPGTNCAPQEHQQQHPAQAEWDGEEQAAEPGPKRVCRTLLPQQQPPMPAAPLQLTHNSLKTGMYRTSPAGRLVYALGAANGDLLRLAPLPGGTFAATLERASVCEELRRMGPAGLLRQLTSKAINRSHLNCSLETAEAMLAHARHLPGCQQGELRCCLEEGGGSATRGAAAASISLRVTIDEVLGHRRKSKIQGMRGVLRTLGAQPGDWLRLEPLPDGTFRASCTPNPGGSAPRLAGQQAPQAAGSAADLPVAANTGLGAVTPPALLPTIPSAACAGAMPLPQPQPGAGASMQAAGVRSDTGAAVLQALASAATLPAPGAPGGAAHDAAKSAAGRDVAPEGVHSTRSTSGYTSAGGGGADQLPGSSNGPCDSDSDCCAASGGHTDEPAPKRVRQSPQPQPMQQPPAAPGAPRLPQQPPEPAPQQLYARVSSYLAKQGTTTNFVLCFERRVSSAVLAHAGLPRKGGHISMSAEGYRGSVTLRLQRAYVRTYTYYSSDAGRLVAALGARVGDRLRLELLPDGGIRASCVAAAPPHDVGGSVPAEAAQQPRAPAAATFHQLSTAAFNLGSVNCSGDEARAMLRHAGYTSRAVQGRVRCWAEGGAGGAAARTVWSAKVVVTSNCFQQECGYLDSMVPLLRALSACKGDVLRLEPQPDGTFRASCEAGAGGQPRHRQQQPGASPVPVRAAQGPTAAEAAEAAPARPCAATRTAPLEAAAAATAMRAVRARRAASPSREALPGVPSCCGAGSCGGSAGDAPGSNTAADGADLPQVCSGQEACSHDSGGDEAVGSGQPAGERPAKRQRLPVPQPAAHKEGQSGQPAQPGAQAGGSGSSSSSGGACPTITCRLTKSWASKSTCGASDACAMLRHAGYPEGATEGVLRCCVSAGPGAPAARTVCIKAEVALDAKSRQAGALQALRPLVEALGARPGDMLRLEPQPGGTFRASCAAGTAGADAPEQQQQRRRQPAAVDAAPGEGSKPHGMPQGSAPTVGRRAANKRMRGEGSKPCASSGGSAGSCGEACGIGSASAARAPGCAPSAPVHRASGATVTAAARAPPATLRSAAAAVNTPCISAAMVATTPALPAAAKGDKRPAQQARAAAFRSPAQGLQPGVPAAAKGPALQGAPRLQGLRPTGLAAASLGGGMPPTGGGGSAGGRLPGLRASGAAPLYGAQPLRAGAGAGAGVQWATATHAASVAALRLGGGSRAAAVVPQ